LIDAGLFPPAAACAAATRICGFGSRATPRSWRRPAPPRSITATPPTWSRARARPTRGTACAKPHRDAAEPSDAERPLLKRLFNQEVYQYALYAAKDRKVNPASWRGFYAQERPAALPRLAGLSTHAGAYAARGLASMVARTGRTALAIALSGRYARPALP
jgi:hypothetical protein